jgi:uncharacterized surface protein with fasciclin (FAS1) repeats
MMMPTMMVAMESQSDLRKFTAAVKSFDWNDFPEIEHVLSGMSDPGIRYTLRAPSNEALAKLSVDQRTALLENWDRLKALLEQSIVQAEVPAHDFWKKELVSSLDDTKIQFELSGYALHVADQATGNGGNVLLIDVLGSNGLIQAISGVLATSTT